MLTFRAMAAGAPSQAAAMAAHLSEQTLPSDRQDLAAYYTRGLDVPPELGARLREVAAEVAAGTMTDDQAREALVEAASGRGGPAPAADAEQALMDALAKAVTALRAEQAGEPNMRTLPQIRPDLHPRVAEALGLDANVTLSEEQLGHLLAGKRADGGAVPGREREISSIDLCFSADKSVSLAWAFAPTEAERAIILQAHNEAVASAMAYVASEIGLARKGAGGEEGAEAGHVGWVSFVHYTSRPTLELVSTDPTTGVKGTELLTLPRVAGDPNLHTHNAIFNLVATDSGRHGSLHTKKLQGRIHEFGAYYQAHLATNLRRSGVSVKLDQRTGAARIVGISDRVRDAFSKRTADANAAAREYAKREGIDWDTLTDSAKIKLLKGGAGSSRKAKVDDLGDFAAWRKQAVDLKWQHRSVLRLDRPIELASQEVRVAQAYEAAMPILAAEFERRSVLSGADMRTAATRGLVAAGISGPEDINRVTGAFRSLGIKQDGQDTNLIWGDERGRTDVSVTTQLHVDQERELVAMAQRGAADRSAALSRPEIDAAVAVSGLDFTGGHGQAQRAAMESLALGGRVGVAIGAAGSGKSAMLSPLVTAWRARGAEVYGIAQAWRQADDLASAGVPARDTMAVRRFLSQAEKGGLPLGPRSLVVVDELGQIGARQMLDLLRAREKFGFTLLAVGDHRQCQSIDAGPVIEIMRQALGADAVPEILTTIRQQTERERDTATMFREGRAAEALERKLQDGMVSVVPGGYRDAVQATADLWAERRAASSSLPGHSLTVSAPTNADARAISEAIRVRRREMGEIGPDLAVIRATDQNGATYDLALGAGDRVRLFDRVWGTGRDGRRLHMGNNGSVVEVVDATPKGLVVRNREGAAGRITWDQLRDQGNQRVRLAHGDALTIDAAQGITSTEHIAAMPGGSRMVNGFKGYVSASRHRVATHIVTSDGQERQEVAGRRPLGDARPITAEDVIENMARNLSRQPAKGSALAFLENALAIHHGAARGLQAGMQRLEARAARGQTPTTAAQGLRQQRDERAVAQVAERLGVAMHLRGQAIQGVAQAVRAAPQPRPAPTAPAAPSRRPVAPVAASMPARAPRPPSPSASDMAALRVAEAADRKAQQAAELHELRAVLANNAESVVEKLLGKPNNRSGSDWRYGAKGSMKVTMKGGRRGLWHDHEAGQGGDLLGLIQKQQGVAFSTAVAWARDHLGMPAPERAKQLTSADRAQMAQHLASMERERARKAAADEAAQAVRHDTVARRATAVWAGAKPAPADHPYLATKGVEAHGLKVDRRGRLRLPLRDVSGKIWSLQHIEMHADGTNSKRFHRRGRADGMFHVLGDIPASGPIAFAEGFATAASVREATGLPVVVTFSVGNKEKVMTAWREREPDRMLIDAADNDHSKPRRSPPAPNAGAEMAERLARDIGAVPALPPFQPHEKGTDWNDYAKTHGPAAVREAMRASVRDAVQVREVSAAAAAQPAPQRDQGVRMRL